MCEHLSPLIGNGSVRRLREAQLLLRILSDVAGWQQRRVAQALEVADATVSQWMCGCPPTEEQLAALRRVARAALRASR
jgi:transcriptional regulator with XRE-family HTH domain